MEREELPLQAARAWAVPLALAGFVLFGACLLLLAAPAAAVFEIEPNNAPAAATDVPTSGSYAILGAVDAATDNADYFRFSFTTAAVAVVTLDGGVDCSADACDSMAVYDAAGQALIDPFDRPMQGDEVYFSGLSGEAFFLQVRAGTAGGSSYTLRVTTYLFPYTAGQKVDITQANDTAAVVTLAGAYPKSSTHPYNLYIEGEEVYYGHAIHVLILNEGPLDLFVEMPAGLQWQPEDPVYTGFVVTRTQGVLVHAWTYVDLGIVVAALSPYGWVPGDPSRASTSPTYFLGPQSSGNLQKVVNECDRHEYAFEAEQIAVWAVTAGLSKADFDQMGESSRGYRDAQTIVVNAGVGTAINPPTARSSWLSWIIGYWPFCFALFFIGVPVLFGISQAFRAVRLATRQIDSAYSVDRQGARDARRDRRAFIQEARQRERDRARQRRDEERAARQHRPAPVPVAVPVPAPAAAPAGPPSAFKQFMAADAQERFDLDALNGLDFNAVLAEAVAGKDTAGPASKKGEELRSRLHQDVNDPDTIDDILRNRLLEWYRESPSASDWSTKATGEWAGLVAESTTAGGRKRAPLERRIAALQDACDAKGKWIKPTPRVEEPNARRGAILAPAALTNPAVLKAEITQAVLDDLSASPRKGDAPFPLPVLSEVAARYTPQRVNNALAEMFKAEPRGPFVVLHPSRYPDCDIAAIRPPAQGAKAGAMSYDIYFAKAAAGTASIPGAAPGGFVATGGPVPGLLDTSAAVWTRDNVTKEEWSAILTEVQRQRARLDPPPGNYRKLSSYFTLRQLLVADEQARLAFIGAKWRGKPVGLPLLAKLLVDKSFMPEYDTDREYFESELGDLERGDPEYLSATGTWTIAPGVVVKRSGGETGTFTYSV